jgi:hypothetical protein
MEHGIPACLADPQKRKTRVNQLEYAVHMIVAVANLKATLSYVGQDRCWQAEQW